MASFAARHLTRNPGLGRSWTVVRTAVLLAWAASSAGAGAGDDYEASAAHMYDRAVELCGAGSLDALNECQALLGRSVALAPDQALAHLTLGHTYRTLRSWEAAVGAFGQVGGCTRARAGAPDGAPPWALEDAGMHLGRALIELDRWDDAIHAFEATFTSFPGASEAIYRHLYLQHFACNFTRRAELLQMVRERVVLEVQTRGGSQMTPSQALMMLDGEELLLVSQAYAAGHLAAESRKAYFAYTPPHLLDTDGRLRIGYVSKDLGFSSVGQLLPRLLGAHNRRRLNVHIYCLNAGDGTPTRKMLEDSAESWHQLDASSPLQIAEQINSDGINIAIDLGGHLSVVSQVSLALQPAPIALNYLSWLGSSGAPYIQAFLTDAVATPPEFVHFHSEALLYMPFSYQVNSNRYMHTHHYNPKARFTLLHPPHQPHGPPPPVDDDAIVFANFNQLFKIDTDTARAWAQILEAVPNSVFTFLNFTGAPEGTRRLQRALTPAAKDGRHRVLFSPFCASKNDFLLLSAGADIFLDNFFYNAGTTGSDVLFAGLPVLTRPGLRMLSRMGASLAAGLGYNALVVRNAEDYTSLATVLARHRTLARVKAILHHRLARGTLFDVDRWVDAYEVLLYTLWDSAITGHLTTGAGRPAKGQRHLVIARPT